MGASLRILGGEAAFTQHPLGSGKEVEAKKAGQRSAVDQWSLRPPSSDVL